MKSDEQLLIWTLLNKDNLGLEMLELDWTKKIAPFMYDFSANLNYKGNEFSGRGSAKDKNTALIKALAEVYERCVLIDNNIKHSNGIAAGADLVMAKSNATAELIERDLFFGHYLTKTPAKIMKDTDFNFAECEIYQALSEHNKKNSIKTELFSLGKSFGKCGTVIFCLGEAAKTPFGLILGLGANESMEKSIESAALECLRKTSWLVLLDKRDSVSLDEFSKIDKIKSSDHGRLVLDLGYVKEFKKIWNTQIFNSGTITDYTTSGSNIVASELSLLDPLFEGLPLIFARAVSDRLQSPTYGSASADNVNLTRLQEFKEGFKIEDLVTLPHPMN